jgi:lysophospholipase L1-like esterase
MPVISRGVPVFASSTTPGSPPGNANGDVYDALDAYSWCSAAVPAWIAYDLSGVPASRRGAVALVWINNTNAYQCNIGSGGTPVGLPTDYTIEANAAPGGTLPVSGWVALRSVTGNPYRSRQHVLLLTGYNWVRMRITLVAGGTTVHLMHLDIHDLSQSPGGQPRDSWIYFGDSITFGGMNYQLHYFQSPNDFTFASLINSRLPAFFPAQEDGGVVGAGIVDAVNNIDQWLSVFPGKFVGISYGTNDATGGMAPETFYDHYAAVVEAVLAAGKVPLVPRIPWGKTALVQANVPLLNQQIDRLYTTFPDIVPGPDLWALFQQNPALINDGDVHPTTEGYGQMKQWWANAMLQNVYHLSTAGVSDPGPEAPLAGPALRCTATTMEYDLPTAAAVSLGVFDLLGRRLMTLVDGSQSAGRHRVGWDSSGLSSGVYFCRLATDGPSVTRALRITR